MTGPRRVGAFVALALAAFIGLNFASTRVYRAWDLTAEHAGTLSDETLRVLRSVDRRVAITSFYRRDTVGRVEASTLLSRYRKANRRISFRILDPTLAPGEAQRLGVSHEGSAAVEDVTRHKNELAQLTIEIDITSAIARLIRGVRSTVCFTTGHGERAAKDTDPTGLSSAVEALRNNGYRIRSVDLLAEPRVPPKCAAVVVAAPTTRLERASVRALRNYLRDAGKAFLLGDPASRVDLGAISKRWGIQFRPGVVFEGDAQAHLPGDVSVPIVTHYSESSPPVQGLGPTFYPRVEGVHAFDTGDPGLTTADVAFTSPLSYLDRGDIGSFDPKRDLKGPVAVGAAADQSEVVANRIRRTRVLAWGDVDFATNAYFADAANARLFLQGVDWLAQPEELVSAVPNFPKVRNLALTEARSRYILLLTAGVVPGLFLIAGGFVWVIRRGR